MTPFFHWMHLPLLTCRMSRKCFITPMLRLQSICLKKMDCQLNWSGNSVAKILNPDFEFLSWKGYRESADNGKPVRREFPPRTGAALPPRICRERTEQEQTEEKGNQRCAIPCAPRRKNSRQSQSSSRSFSCVPSLLCFSHPLREESLNIPICNSGLHPADGCW